MEPPQAKSVRHRRRWLIVAFALVLVGVAWWNLPRGDARFVGRWSVTDLRNGTETDVGQLTLWANGSLVWNCYLPSEFRPVNWTSKSDRLTIRDGFLALPQYVQSWGQWFNRFVLNNTRPLGGQFDCLVLSVTPEQIELEAGPGIHVVLSRLPE